MGKPDRTCYGTRTCMHIGPCCDFWADDGMCVCNPVDAATYPQSERLYIAVNIRGFRSPNIRTIFPDGTDDVYAMNSGWDYAWIYWDWGGFVGTVKFELRDGSAVKATRSTKITIPPPPAGAFTLTSIKPSSTTFTVGDTAKIDARWRNNTNQSQEVELALIVDGVEYRSIEWIVAGSTGSLRFNIPLNKVGTFEITGTNNPDNIVTTITVHEPDPCEGIVCPDKCSGVDLWSQGCLDGICSFLNLIEANSSQCGYTPAPVDPCAGVTCENVCIGVNLYSQKCVNGVCVTDQLIESNSSQCGYIPPEPEPEYLCEVEDKRSLHTCWDGSQIYTEICKMDESGETSWVPTGETCPPMAVKRSMELAIPKIMYEGQPIDIVLQSYYGATPSSGEPATLTVDGATVRTINTTAGTVKFRWIATGVGMRRVCVNIPANPVCEVPGSACQTVMVSAYVSGLAEQIKREKEAYDVELARLRKLRDIERARLMRVGIPGMVSIPPSLAGAIVEIGGVPTTVPTEGISVRVPSGESIVTIIDEGIRKPVPVLVSPGETIPLPPLPGGL